MARYRKPAKKTRLGRMPRAHAVRDQDFSQRSREAFAEAFVTHTSTSPNQQLMASLDLARRQVDLVGFQMVCTAYKMALVFRLRVRTDRLTSRWFAILHEGDLVPDEYRRSQTSREGPVGRTPSTAGTMPGSTTSSSSTPPGSACTSARPA